MAKLLAVNWRDLRNPEAGGAEVHLHEILQRMAARGHEVTCFAAGFPGGAKEETYDGIRVIRRGQWYNANFVLPWHVRAFAKRHSPDLIIEDINKIPFFLPSIVKTPVLAVIPHLFGTTVFRETNFLFASYVYFWEWLIPRVYGKCRFVAISPSTKDDLIARGIRGGMVDVVLCGLDHNTYRPLDGESRADVPTVVHFGRIRKYKSIDIVIRAFRQIREQIPNARLVIVGDGPEKQNLVNLTSELGLGDSVDFTGMIATSELVQLLNRSHLFLNPSPKEGWGLTVVEANACGMPVVASDRPGLRDSVLDGKTGHLVPYADAQAFAEKAVELLRDDQKWSQMSAAGLEWARSLTWERTADEMETLFKRAMQ